MNCTACAEARQVDGLTPDCETPAGCLIPPLLPEGQRVLELRGLLMRLQPLVDAGTVCRTYGATLEDLQLLAVVEDELKPPEKTKDKDDGQGR